MRKGRERVKRFFMELLVAICILDSMPYAALSVNAEETIPRYFYYQSSLYPPM